VSLCGHDRGNFVSAAEMLATSAAKVRRFIDDSVENIGD